MPALTPKHKQIFEIIRSAMELNSNIGLVETARISDGKRVALIFVHARSKHVPDYDAIVPVAEILLPEDVHNYENPFAETK